MDVEYVLVIGSAGLDIKGLPDNKLEWSPNNLGRVRNSVGGVARNIAENLARLEVPTILLSALGDDDLGERVRAQSASAGINCDYIKRIPGQRTSTYLAILANNGEVEVALHDIAIMSQVDSAYIHANSYLFADADMVVIDATLSDEALKAVFDIANQYHVRVCADPTAPILAGRLCPYIHQHYLIVPNAGETRALCGLEDAAQDRESAINAARHLVSLGAEIAVVTVGAQGVAYADSSGGGFIRAIKTEVVDATGAGDAFSGAVIFGLLNEVPVDEAMRLGVTAASLTLRSRETVLPNLSQELLYDELIA